MKELQIRLNNDISEAVKNRVEEYIPKSIADVFIDRLNDNKYYIELKNKHKNKHKANKKLYMIDLLAREYYQTFLSNNNSRKGINIANVKYRLYRARNVLKEYYKRTVPSGFKLIPDHEKYAVDTSGNVIRVSTRNIMKQFLSKGGYIRVGIRNKDDGAKTMVVHRLVMLTYVGPSNLTVDHLNANKTDNRLANLEYVTIQENIRRSDEMGLRQVGEEHAWSKLTEADVIDIYTNNEPTSKMMVKYNIGESSVNRIRSRKKWKSVTKGLVKGTHKVYLSDDAIKEIYVSPLETKELMDKYSVSKSAICKIRSGYQSSHLTKDLVSNKPNRYGNKKKYK